jgi:hypothetical protein
MPERWQHELRKLRGEEMPEAIRERAESGPQHELPRDGRQRLVAGVVAFAVFIGAGAFAWRAFDRDAAPGSTEPTPSPAPTAVVSLLESASKHPGYPSGEISFGGDRAPGQLGSFSWGNAIIDTVTPEFHRPLAVPPGTAVEVRGDADVIGPELVLGDDVAGRRQPITLSSGTFELPSTPGRYFLEVTGTWAKGTVSFYFPVVVSDRTVTIHLLDQVNGPVALITSGDRTIDGFRESFGWCNDAGCTGADADYSYAPAPEAFLPVAPGAMFLNEGSGELTRLVVRTVGGDAASPNVISDTDGSGATTPIEPGPYVVWISATWGDRGSGTFLFGIEVTPPTEDIPDVLHLTCTPELATLDQSIVRAQADGVHIAIDASDDVHYAEVIVPSGMSGFGVDERSDGSEGIWAEPGEWFIGCPGDRGGLGPSDVGSEALAPFSVVDPDDYYAEPDLVCSDTTTTSGPTSLPPTDPYPPMPDAVGAALSGLGPTDLVREGGYGAAERFKLGPTYVVQRHGETIATIRLGSAPDDVLTTWAADLETCSDSGIALMPPDQVSQAPDVAVVRCTSDGTELDTPVVEIQADGLHVDATNFSNAFQIDIEPATGSNMGFDAFDGSNHAEVVLPVPPGDALIACLFLDGDQIVQGGSDDHPDWYVPIEIVDREA